MNVFYSDLLPKDNTPIQFELLQTATEDVDEEEEEEDDDAEPNYRKIHKKTYKMNFLVTLCFFIRTCVALQNIGDSIEDPTEN